MAESTQRFDDGAAYERFMGRWSRAVGGDFLRWVGAPQHADWIDVGCGTGIFTQLILDTCAPRTVIGIDPEPAQIEHARRQSFASRADFRVGDAQQLPFDAASFDIVASALVINFVPDRTKALEEMRRVGRPGGIIAGYVWDFAAEASPSWPMRMGLQKQGYHIADRPGTEDSTIVALQALFTRVGLEAVSTTTFEVTVPYPNFDDFWQAQTPSFSPITKKLSAMTAAERSVGRKSVRSLVSVEPDDQITYSARANAIKARIPG